LVRKNKMQRLEDGMNILRRVVEIPVLKVAAEGVGAIDMLQAFAVGSPGESKWTSRQHVIKARLAEIQGRHLKADIHRNLAGNINESLKRRAGSLRG
jgi:hypothetical protein